MRGGFKTTASAQQNRNRRAVNTDQPTIESLSVRATLLCFAMLLAIVVFGVGVYSVDASDETVVDGYGVVARY
jgi:hypothetical protein